MGVRGLETFVKENRTSLTKSVTLPSIDGDGSPQSEEARTPIIVDAWGIIFKLYLDTLPWTSGGEYLRYYKLVKKLVIAWRKVGLEPTFVFDGAAPPEKHNTILSRASEKLVACQLFYTTSVTSRSSPSFSRGGKVVLPFFASHAFIFALHRLGAKTHFVPAGEADGVCVTMAEKVGGYVFSRDSDFVILVGRTERVKGYVPLDMLSWIEGEMPKLEISKAKENKYIPPGARHAASLESFQPVSNGRKNNNPYSSGRQSSMIPPSTLINPTLVLTFIPPQALRHRLRLPSTHLPLFASLCGTDYIPPSVTQQFFENSLTVCQRIEKAARILREQLFAPTTPSKKNVNINPGDQVVELVKRVIKKLCIYPFDTEQALDETVDRIIEGALQYSLPHGGSCCSTYPFCGELDPMGCQTPITMGEGTLPILNQPSMDSEAYSGKEAYSAAQRKGLVGTITHGWLYPDRMYQWQVLEDVSGPCLKASEGAREIRRAAWIVADEGLGGMRWPTGEEDNDEEGNQLGGNEPEPDNNHMKVDDELQELLGVSSATASDVGGGRSESTTLVERDATSEIGSSATVNKSQSIREMVEYLRQGSTSRIVASQLSLPPPTILTPGEVPTCSRPLEERLELYLEPLHSNTPSIRSLPTSLQPLVSLIRFSVIDAAQRSKAKTDQHKWRREEVVAVLRACIGTYTMWKREIHSEESAMGKSKVINNDEGSGGKLYPLLETRNAILIAQIGSFWSDAQMLAQALLLLPEVAIQPSPDSPVSTEENDLGVTHIIPFIFFSGINLHSLLSKNEPSPASGWRWTSEEQNIFDRCWTPLIDGLEEGVIVGLNRQSIGKNPLNNDTDTIAITQEHQEGEGEGEVDGSKKSKKKKRRKSSNSITGRNGNNAHASGGRFGILEDLIN
ncbi:uncharacterized protein IL334_001561 [Kwoniella shivajii]|uniref:Asteroid domain-containing protein n=1 Tax=Kwoniella shivajii TaxID=564305 RepID=A0ABZ1CS91_9TREE|nr:hypothetical protein IL334_001561 [Kwoniella shivajii]